MYDITLRRSQFYAKINLITAYPGVEISAERMGGVAVALVTFEFGFLSGRILSVS